MLILLPIKAAQPTRNDKNLLRVCLAYSYIPPASGNLLASSPKTLARYKDRIEAIIHAIMLAFPAIEAAIAGIKNMPLPTIELAMSMDSTGSVILRSNLGINYSMQCSNLKILLVSEQDLKHFRKKFLNIWWLYRFMITVFRLVNHGLEEIPISKMQFHDLKLIISSNTNQEQIKTLAQALSLPEDRLADFTDENRRPNIVLLDNFVVITFKAPIIIRHHYKSKSFSVLFSDKCIVILMKSELDVVKSWLDNTEEIAKSLSKSPEEFVIDLLQEVIEHYFNVVMDVVNAVESIESRSKSELSQRILNKIFSLKKTVLYLHMALMGNRDALNSLYSILKNKEKHIANLVMPVTEDVNQLIDMLTLQRDLLAGTLAWYMSSMNANLNIIVKKLTAFATIIGIPILITGIYGMNFKHMPELYWRYGYPFSLLLMFITGLITYIFFKRKEWI